jgi:hypothetical protein
MTSARQQNLLDIFGLPLSEAGGFVVAAVGEGGALEHAKSGLAMHARRQQGAWKFDATRSSSRVLKKRLFMKDGLS